MKKFYFIAVMALATLTTNAQEKLTLSTYNGTKLEKYDGHICNVTVNRYMFKGWNTIALPFDVTAEELNETFGADCRLERLIGVENVGNDIQLNFQDCKDGGMKAHTPYILYYNGEPANKKISKEASISSEKAILTFSTPRGETVTMAGAQEKIAGIGFYGILAKDNEEAKFAKVDGSLNGFYATRCYVQLTSATANAITTRHITASDATSISADVNDNEQVDVYNTNGVKVASKVNAEKMSNLQPGIYMVKGKKVLVK